MEYVSGTMIVTHASGHIDEMTVDDLEQSKAHCVSMLDKYNNGIMDIDTHIACCLASVNKIED